LMRDIRQSIVEGQFDHFAANFLAHWRETS
jgi:queuine/archaeosine tRNA-ribosyltransferase